MSSLHSSLAQDALNLYFGVVDKTLLGVRDDLRGMGKSEEQVMVILERLRQKWQQKLSDLHCIDSYGQSAGQSQVASGMGTSSIPSVPSSSTSTALDSNGRPILTAESIVPRSRKRMRKSTAVSGSASAPSIHAPSFAKGNAYAEGTGIPTSLDEIHNPFVDGSSLSSVASTMPGTGETFTHPSAAQMVHDHSGLVQSGDGIMDRSAGMVEESSVMVGAGGASSKELSSSSLADAWSALGAHSSTTVANDTTVTSSSTLPTTIDSSAQMKQDQQESMEVKKMDDSTLISSTVDNTTTSIQSEVESSETAMMNLTRADADTSDDRPAVAVGFSDDEDDEDEENTEKCEDRYELAKRELRKQAEKKPDRPKHMYNGRDLNGPLDTDDDDSGDILDSDIQTDNILICQFEKVDRKKNDWKVQLRNGVLHVHGKDYAFRTFANGSFLWEE